VITVGDFSLGTSFAFTKLRAGEILEEIYKHLESVMSSEPIRRQDQNVLSILEKEVVRFVTFTFGKSEVVNRAKGGAPPVPA